MISRRFIKISFPVLLVLGIYFLGPEPEKPVFNLTLPQVSADPVGLETLVRNEEARHHTKADNESHIVWNDSTKQKTEYAVVYLHGFSASPMEGDPVHKNFAKEFGCNLYLPRLADHGIDTTEAALYYTADRAWESAKQALAIGKQLGNKVILITTSTGGTLALKLAAEYPADVYAMINMSPNVAINDPAAFLLDAPWGLQIARMVMGGNYMVVEQTPERDKYWYGKYRLEALTQLQELVDDTMTKELFARIKQPALTLYYYKNEAEQDPTVKVSALLKMHEQLATPADMKVAVAIPNAGSHVIGSSLTSKDVDGVYAQMEKFALEKLAMKPAAALAVATPSGTQ